MLLVRTTRDPTLAPAMKITQEMAQRASSVKVDMKFQEMAESARTSTSAQTTTAVEEKCFSSTEKSPGSAILDGIL